MDTATELSELETRYWTAIRDQDGDAASRLTADPCIVAGAQGVASIGTSMFLSMMNDQTWRLDQFELMDVNVRQVREDVAVIAYRVKERLEVDGEPLTLEAADTSTWVRSGDGWRCAVHTESLIGDPFGRDRPGR